MLSSTGAIAAACRMAIERNPAVNVPTLEVENAVPLPTYYTRQGDAVRALIVTDDSDGAATTGVEVYEAPSTLLGSATNDGGGNWHLDFVAGAPAERQIYARRLTGSGDLDSVNWPLKSVQNPIEIWGNTRLRHWRFAQASDLGVTGTAIDSWSDISTNATPTPGAAALTARPEWRAPAAVANDGAFAAPSFLEASGKWGYARYDGTANVLNIAAMNLPTPGAAQKNYGWMVFRNWGWTNLDRICASIGVNARQVIYQSPTASPATSMLNGAASAQNTVTGVPIGQACLMMFEFTGSTSDFLQMFNYKATGGNAGTSAGTTGRKEGGDVAAGVFGRIDVQQAGYVLGSSSVTQAEIDELVDFCKYLYQPGVAACDANLIVEGDSLSANPNLHGACYAEQAFYQPKLVKSHFIASGGNDVLDTIAQFPGQALPLKNTGTAPSIPNIYSLLVGINDIDAGRLAPDIYNDIVANVALAHAQGMLVVGWNLLDQFRWTSGSKLTEFNALRALLVANLPSVVDAFVNPAGVIPGTGGDGIYWDDDIHPTALGQSFLVPIWVPAVQSLAA